MSKRKLKGNINNGGKVKEENRRTKINPYPANVENMVS
jgi:hypothetical protein